MKTIKLSFLLILLFTFSVTAQDSHELKMQIQEMNNKLIKAMIAEDWDGIMSVYADDAVSLPNYQPMIKGKDAIMNSGKESYDAGFKINEMSLNTMEVYAGGNLACEIGTYTINMTIPGMQETWDDNGKYLTVWEKQFDGSWKIKIETWNTDNNPWMDMSMPEGEYDDEEHEE